MRLATRRRKAALELPAPQYAKLRIPSAMREHRSREWLSWSPSPSTPLQSSGNLGHFLRGFPVVG